MQSAVVKASRILQLSLADGQHEQLLLERKVWNAVTAIVRQNPALLRQSSPLLEIIDVMPSKVACAAQGPPSCISTFRKAKFFPIFYMKLSFPNTASAITHG